MPLRASEHAYQTSERASGLALGPDWPRFFEEDSYRVPRGGSNRLTRERKREREREREREKERVKIKGCIEEEKKRAF